MIKQLIDLHFANHYGLGRIVSIDESQTTADCFDVKVEHGAKIVAYGSGYASFSNASQNKVSILDYEGYIDKYAGTTFYSGLLKCDFILESETEATVVLDEVTSSNGGIENLQKVILGKRSYPGGKFEKAENQLVASLQTLFGVPEIAKHLAKQIKRVCLCSYKLYTSDELALIGDPVGVFSRGLKEAEKQVGENGVKISSPLIEALGFEYRRLSHSFTFSV